VRRALAQLSRELRSLWVTPLAYLLLTLFLLLQGSIFVAVVLSAVSEGDGSAGTSPLAAYYGQNSLLLTQTLLLLTPALTMRSFAEERRSGSIELLLSSPLCALGLTLSKYAAVLLTFCAFWIPTGLYPLLLRTQGPVEPGPLFTSYLGILLLGMSTLSLGLLMSALSKSQLLSHMLTSTALLLLFVAGLGEYVFDAGVARELSAYVSLSTLLEETSRGVLHLRRVAFHGSLTLYCLFLTTLVVQSWRSE